MWGVFIYLLAIKLVKLSPDVDTMDCTKKRSRTSRLPRKIRTNDLNEKKKLTSHCEMTENNLAFNYKVISFDISYLNTCDLSSLNSAMRGDH